MFLKVLVECTELCYLEMIFPMKELMAPNVKYRLIEIFLFILTRADSLRFSAKTFYFVYISFGHFFALLNFGAQP